MIYSRFSSSSNPIIGSFRFSVCFDLNWFRVGSGDKMFIKTFAHQCPVGFQFHQKETLIRFLMNFEEVFRKVVK